MAAACAVSAALVAGCGTEHASSGGAQPVGLAAAVSHTQDQTARISATIATQIQSMTVSYTETGLYDFAHSRGMISMQGPFDLTEIFIPPTTYVKLPADIADAGGSVLPKGKTWTAIPDSEDGDPAAALGPLGSSGGSDDPAGLLAALTALSSSETKLGPSVIRGVPVTGYALKIDSANLAKVPGSDRADVQALLKSLGSTKIPVDVWVDGRNLVRREKLTLGLVGGSGVPAGAPMTMTTDFYDFGVPVRVSAPPAAQVAREPQSFSASGSSVAPAVSASASAGSPGSFEGGAAVPPPAASGSLTPAQATSAEQAVSAFWAALGRNDLAAVESTVLPGEKSCVQSDLGSGGLKFTASALRITSAQPAGSSGATILFTINAGATIDGHGLPILPGGPSTAQWLATTEVGGHWYVNINDSTALAFGGTCS